LLASFGVIVVLMLLLGIFSITRLSSEDSHVNTVANKIVPATSLVGQTAALMNKYRKDQLHYILSTPAERAGSQGVDGDLAGDLTLMAALLKQYRADGFVANARDAQLMAAFQKDFYAYVSESAAFRRLADVGETQAAGQVVGAGSADNTYTNMKAASTAWTDYQSTLARQAAASAHSTYTTGVVLVLVLLVIAVLTAVLIAFLISRRVIGGVRKVGVAAAGIARGELEQRLDLRGNDELTDMAAEFRGMMGYLGGMSQTATRIAEGDLTSEIEPLSEQDELGTAFAQMNRNLRVALGGQSSLVQVTDRLGDLDACLGDLGRGLVAMTDGDLTVAVDSDLQPITAVDGSAVGELAELFNSMLGRAQASLAAYNEMRETLRHALGDQSSLDALSARLESLRARTLAELEGALRAMSEGDLRCEVDSSEEPIVAAEGYSVGRLAEVFNGMLASTRASVGGYNETRAKIVAMIAEISRSSEALASSSTQMSSTSEEAGRAIAEIANAVNSVAQGAEDQVRSVDKVRRVTDEVAEASRVSVEATEETARAAAAARGLARDGVDAAEHATVAMRAVRDSSEQVSDTIRSLGAKSDEIGGIVATITGIAAQTNLLALNAAIEAARAGEHGRGFAVVAEEVRHLAEESQHAAATIGSLIEQIQSETARAVAAVQLGVEQTHGGVETVAQTREAFTRIGESVEDVTARVEQIAGAIRQIAEGGEQMRDSIATVAAVAEQSSASSQEVSASTEQSSASTQEIAASAQQLAATAGELDLLVRQFTLL
jgi:methyl-accepting chemotaxis protein